MTDNIEEYVRTLESIDKPHYLRAERNGTLVGVYTMNGDQLVWGCDDERLYGIDAETSLEADARSEETALGFVGIESAGPFSPPDSARD